MAYYERAYEELARYTVPMIERYHPELRDAGVTFTYLMAYAPKDKNGDPVGVGLKHAGYPALAVIKVIGLKERADKRADAELTVDGDRWPELSDDNRFALIDHELEHIELKRDKKDGSVLYDDVKRPKIKMRHHDHQFGWFDSIVRRHGRAACEFMQFEKFSTEDYKYKWLPFLDKPDDTPKQNLIDKSAEEILDSFEVKE